MEDHSHKSDDVDLRLIFNKIGQWFSRIWNSLIFFVTNCILITKKRWRLIFTFFILGTGLGTGLFYFLRPVYASTLVLSSKVLNNNFCADMIDNLNLVIDDETPEVLAKKLKINISSAMAIKELEFDNYNEKIRKNYDNEDTVILGLPFIIKAYTYNNTVFDTLQTALVNYLEDNEYSMKRKKISIQNIKDLANKINSDIYELDSLKFVIASNMIPRGSENGFVFGQPLDPINTFREGINLYKENLELNTSLALIDNVQVIQDFFPRSKPDSPRLARNIVIYGAGGFLLGLIIAFYLERRKILVHA